MFCSLVLYPGEDISTLGGKVDLLLYVRVGIV